MKSLLFSLAIIGLVGCSSPTIPEDNSIKATVEWMNTAVAKNMTYQCAVIEGLDKDVIEISIADLHKETGFIFEGGQQYNLELEHDSSFYYTAVGTF